ncbi:hypothetical protein BJY04DRAFT_194385 [Aspergillus karnatakaensis]|uniref:uncharacterized protein n=1 Tax=Aspergillus karnatakaensis TaxID=1810916 RepID=UPI003CCCCBE0
MDSCEPTSALPCRALPGSYTSQDKSIRVPLFKTVNCYIAFIRSIFICGLVMHACVCPYMKSDSIIIYYHWNMARTQTTKAQIPTRWRLFNQRQQ